MKCITDAWEKHQHELLRFIAARVPDNHEANDLLQEVFLRATRMENGLCGVENPRAWLFQVTRNLLIDLYRLRKDEVALDENLPEATSAQLAPVDRLTNCLPRVLQELTPEDREAITLCDIEGMSQQAYAAHLSLTLPAAKSRVQRARKRLRAQLVTACQVTFDESGQVCCFTPRNSPE